MQHKTSHWVFGYGSLIWRPGFAFLASQRALLPGAHRRLCVLSFRHRGTAAAPGLVFGLVPGGSCRGMAFAVDPQHWDEVHAYLMERERDNGVYVERTRPIRLADGKTVEALVYMVDRRHPQYAGMLSLDEQVRLVRRGVGESGPNPDYVRETARHLSGLGIHDRYLEDLVAALDATP